MIKKIFLPLKLAAVSLFSTLPLITNAQSTEFLTYEDFYPEGEIIVRPSPNAKIKRVSSKKRGKVIYDISGEDMPDSLRTCIKVAADVWSNYLHNEDSLKLQIFYDDTSTADMKISVCYYIYEQMAIPQSLLRERYNIHENYPFDAIIHINKNSNWGLGLRNISKTSKNLTYALMRAIGTSLGFGSSIKKDERRGTFSFTSKKPSPFDKLIFSQTGNKLSDIDNSKSQDLANFVQPASGYLYIHKQSDDYKLYAPSIFDSNKSLKYLINNKSLMHYDIPADTVDLVIDDVTVDLLNAIGWNIEKEQNIEIIGEGIDDTGVASAYQAYRFYLKPNSLNIANHKWTYELPLTNGEYEIVAHGNNADFNIPAIADENKYSHTLEGDIAGIIRFRGTSGNKTVTGTYNLTLELKPHIIKAEIINIKPSGYFEGDYDILVGVQYEGSHYLYAVAAEEDHGVAQSFFSDTPYYTNLHITNVWLEGFVWIELTARNQHGSDVAYIEIPTDIYSLNKNNTTGISNNNENNILNIKIYDINGTYLGDTDNIRSIKAFKNKLLILKLYRNNEFIKTVKYTNK
ncbi:hypothetical protein [Xylanibacter caecicola]|uniref:hypothetical protein n=1 Tax=Xylanibacter caecicola TaxID=2736294 RepID=UPI00258A67D7|nr:hypothetical protein [Xylanibacter caecicola]